MMELNCLPSLDLNLVKGENLLDLDFALKLLDEELFVQFFDE